MVVSGTPLPRLAELSAHVRGAGNGGFDQNAATRTQAASAEPSERSDAAARFLASGRNGYCAVTEPGSDCNRDAKGSLPLTQAETQTWWHASAACLRKCAACGKCAHISVSLRFADCVRRASHASRARCRTTAPFTRGPVYTPEHRRVCRRTLTLFRSTLRRTVVVRDMRPLNAWRLAGGLSKWARQQGGRCSGAVGPRLSSAHELAAIRDSTRCALAGLDGAPVAAHYLAQRPSGRG